MMVLHSCDNPPCVRPDHLFRGTHADNMRDMRAKGRAAPASENFRLTGALARARKRNMPECKRGHDIRSVKRDSVGRRDCPKCKALRKRIARERAA